MKCPYCARHSPYRCAECGGTGFIHCCEGLQEQDMTSLMDWGKNQEVADRVKESKCTDGGLHDWEAKGSWPSTWGKCKKCGETYFDK